MAAESTSRTGVMYSTLLVWEAWRGSISGHQLILLSVPCTSSSQEERRQSLGKSNGCLMSTPKSFIQSPITSSPERYDPQQQIATFAKKLHQGESGSSWSRLHVPSLLVGLSMDFVSAYRFGIRTSSNFVPNAEMLQPFFVAGITSIHKAGQGMWP